MSVDDAVAVDPPSDDPARKPVLAGADAPAAAATSPAASPASSPEATPPAGGPPEGVGDRETITAADAERVVVPDVDATGDTDAADTDPGALDRAALDPAALDPAALDPAAVEAAERKRRKLTIIRRVSLGVWAVGVAVHVLIYGLAFDRTRLIILLCLGMIAATIGRRRALTVIIDWLPFALVLMFYDWTRDVAVWLGMPTQWHLAVDVDHAMFGVNPTVWLQEHLKHPGPTWWEIITSSVYMSYFIIPYAAAAVLWLRDRKVWRRYAICFVATTFLALVGYTLVPAAPPWAAAKCSAAEVAAHPHDPPCMYSTAPRTDGGLLGPVTPTHEGAAPYVERISARGWDYLNIHAASNLVQVGQGKSNLVAAIPSLHAGLTMLLALFMWPRVRALGRTLFVGYAFAMAFTLVFTAEHYVFDILLGWALAASVVVTCYWVDRRWIAGRTRAEEDRPEPVAAVSPS